MQEDHDVRTKPGLYGNALSEEREKRGEYGGREEQREEGKEGKTEREKELLTFLCIMIAL